ncbi:chlorophyll a/b-binding protein [Nostoc sp. WHI]|uniref:chlorophyll a/b-binding protein n=1 Tax=Nostoc sp. WHI TaxID=2650611 RepID=UPI0018C673AF|nr:chlorophyll a/b-binding protein [Nostoc sp. WHI]MBG1269384.1 high light inducible protein [Nostoc sp. WHI]
MRSGSILDEQDKLNNLAIAPQMYVTQQSQLGLTDYAEKLNGRLAMIGFVSLLAVEILTGHGAIAFLNSL